MRLPPPPPDETGTLPFPPAAAVSIKLPLDRLLPPMLLLPPLFLGSDEERC